MRRYLYFFGDQRAHLIKALNLNTTQAKLKKKLVCFKNILNRDQFYENKSSHVLTLTIVLRGMVPWEK